jgi:AAA15 family ATPase/GTPase
MINRAELKNFGPIKELDWQNLGKINLIIGNNGCGKSFLLKALYSAVRTLEEYKRGDNPESVSDILWKKLHWTFQPEKKIGDLVTKLSDVPLFLSLTLKLGLLEEIAIFNYSFGKDTTNTIGAIENSVENLSSNSVFLPAKEVLSLHHLILQLSEDKSFGFDAAYVDLARALQRKRFSNVSSPLDVIQILQELAEKDENKIEASQKLLKLALEFHEKNINSENKRIDIQNRVFKKCRDNLEKIVEGRIEYDETENRWYFKKGRQRFSIGMTAEGIKKIAILDTLLGNGYLSKDSIVFIDEPESALHPEAIAKLFDIIAILANHGIQFFIASHSYFVIKKLFLIAQEQQMSIPVLSYQNDEWVQSDLKDDLPNNPIIDESIRIYEQEVDLVFK